MKKFLILISLVLVLGACGTSTNDEDKQEDSQKKSGGEVEQNNDIEQYLEQLSFSTDVKTDVNSVSFKMSLENKGEEPIDLSFSSGQQFEIVVKDQETNEEVYRYSEDKAFTLALITETLEPGDVKTWEEKWDYTKDGQRVEAKDYDVDIELVLHGVEGNDLEQNLLNDQTTISVPVIESTESQNEQDEIADSEHFRNIKVSGTNGSYTVTGEARVFEGVFQYNVEDGHHILVEEQTVQTAGAPEWGTFELDIEISEDKMPSYGVLMLVLYFESAKTGQPEGYHNVVLENLNN
ncbi:BsuPI-related putative proteinase inhibitor [Bacillaceae bacterium W0354]